MNILKKYILGMILRPIVMIGIWIGVISGMTTTFIFYFMTLCNVPDLASLGNTTNVCVGSKVYNI
jgi:hypothetical protein